MATEITNVFTDLGEGRITYKEFQDLGIITGPRTRPRMLDKGMNGYYLGLYDPNWANVAASPSGAETYFVQIVPLYREFTDPDADYAKGVPTIENTTKGTTFYFDPFPDDYACDGYEVWAGTVTGTLYKQGTLESRFITTFTLGVTWTYSTAGAVLSGLTIGPPAFASLVSVYQGEGEVNSRVVLAGGEKYSDGYAKVAVSTTAPTVTCDTAGSATFGDWAAVDNGSFRMRINKDWFDFTAIDFAGDGSMANVATTLQTKIQAALDPKLICGSAPTTTIATWTAITDGSFNIVVNGISYDITGLDFSGEATMANMAAVIQTAIQTTIGTGMYCTWDATAGRFTVYGSDDTGVDVISNGTFDSADDWTLPASGWSIGGGFASYVPPGAPQVTDFIYQDTAADLRGKSWKLAFDAKVNTAGTSDSFRATLGNPQTATPRLLDFPDQALDTDGAWHSYELEGGAVTVGGTQTRLYLQISTSSGSDYDIDNIVLTQISTEVALSYLARHSSETGTDVSEMMAGRFDSTGVILNKHGKDASSHTVTWSTDHFVIADVNTGYAYRLSLLEAVSADAGTDISGASWLNGLSSSKATYSPGQTAKRSVLGNGTNWGDWTNGMKFRGTGEPDDFLILEWRSATELVLDEDYVGDAYNGWTAYSLEPYDDQLYVSALGNPFGYSTDRIVKLPVEKSEGITGLKTAASNTVIFMQESTWIMDSVDITSPIRVSPDDGCPNNEAAIEHDNGVAFYSGDDFKYVRGRQAPESIDPEDRMRQIIGRISSNAPYPIGVRYPSYRSNILMWIVGLDDSFYYNTAICYNPKTGAWWLYNMKDASCATTLKDAAGKDYLATGCTYDDAHSVPSFVKLYSKDYYNDGASQVSTNTKQGIIATGGVGAATTTAGFLTCGTAFSATFGDWTGFTACCFRITIDDVELDVGPFSLAAAGSMAAIAALIQVAIRAATGAGGAETCTWSTDHFIITSGTTTNRSTVDYMRPYFPTTSITDLSSESYCNGRTGFGTKTWAQNYLTLTLRNWDDDAAAVLSTTNDGEEGVYIALCTDDGEDLQYCLITSNTAASVTVTPVPSTLPVAGWRWFLGGIVPTWYKWFDFGSPQHLQKMVAMAITTEPNQVSAGNYLHMLYYHDLKTTLRESYNQQLGTGNDTVNTIEFNEREATQHGIRLIRPSSEHDLTIEDLTFTHHPLA